MINPEEIHRQAEIFHQANTKRVMELLARDYDLHKLETVFDPELSNIYRTVLPGFAELCEVNRLRPLTDEEKEQFSIYHASLYACFGDDKMDTLAALWIVTRSMRKALGN